MGEVAKIQKLDETVVNKIAAGEVIQRPANALKELIENSLDAKSTIIQITVRDGGLKMLQIQDNGTGIRQDDMEIVCKRFTTSKLKKFEDLQSISTFGFRGEALASISHVAQLTITTKTAQDKVAYKASYVDSNLQGAPKRLAGNQGTTILIENLFYNVPIRRNALANTAEEFNKIVDVVTSYAIHNPLVGFTLKKQGEILPHVRAPHNSTKLNTIKLLFGNTVAREIIEINIDELALKFKMEALITNANYTGKKMIFLLFINHRLVESKTIKKMLVDLYSIYLPKKSNPWCYISLDINPMNIDVNIHPTKQEVRFLHEEIIIEKMKIALDEKLSSNNSSRTFYVQTRLPEVDMTKETLEQVLPEYEKSEKIGKKPYQKEIIRTDCKSQKLEQFDFTIQNKNRIETESSSAEFQENTAANSAVISPIDSINISSIEENSKMEIHIPPAVVTELFESEDETQPEIPLERASISDVADRAIKTVLRRFGSQVDSEMQEIIDKSTNKNLSAKMEASTLDISTPEANSRTFYDEKNDSSSECSSSSGLRSYSVNNFRREVKLTSVLMLRKKVEDTYHRGLRKILSEMTFVGCVDEKLALIQSGVNLYICNTMKLAEELFYEIMLYDFANFGILKFDERLSLIELALIGLDLEEAGWTEAEGPKEILAEDIKTLLMDKAAMLKEYFCIVIDTHGNLQSLPVLLDKYFPCEAELPMFILRLSTSVEWSVEQTCFDDICREVAKLYSHANLFDKSSDWRHVTEHIVYPAIKESLLPPKHFAHDSTILQITSLPNLYKVFERC